MFRIFLTIPVITCLLTSCKSAGEITEGPVSPQFTLAFGSCNRHDLPNLLWDDVLDSDPDLWIWGGDIIYGDTSDMELLRSYYQAQRRVPGYRQLRRKIPVTGTWDDHDYGLNDGGADFEKRAESQVQILDFLEVGEDDPRRNRDGIYTSMSFSEGQIKVILLDTRFFRSPLIPDTTGPKRYRPGTGGTILGEAQWNWLSRELNNSKAYFNIIVSSIQVLSSEHGYETWGNFPEERQRLLDLIGDSKANGVIILSGDRHISEFSKEKIEKLNYPLIDFTSSGLTHSYDTYDGEPNPYRVGEVISTTSFGLLEFFVYEGRVTMEIVGDNGVVLSRLEQDY